MEADTAAVFDALDKCITAEKKSALPETIGGVKIWSEEERAKFFRRKHKMVIPLLDEWNELSCGAIGRIGPVLTIARDAERGPDGKISLESFVRCYEESAKERDKELAILANGTEAEKKKLAEKYPDVDEVNLQAAIRTSHGHTYDEIAAQAKHMYDVINYGMGEFCKPHQYDIETITNLYISRIYDATLTGFAREEKASEWLNTVLRPKGYTIKESDYQTDVTEGIDFELYYKGRLVGGVQVKGYNYSNCNVRGEVTSHVRLSQQHKNYKARTGAEILFCYVEDYKGLLQVRNANEIVRISNEIKERIDAKAAKEKAQPRRDRTVIRTAHGYDR